MTATLRSHRWSVASGRRADRRGVIRRFGIATVGLALLFASACSTTDVGDEGKATNVDPTASEPSDNDEGTVEPGPTTGLTDTTIKIAIGVPDFTALVEQGLVPNLGDIEAEMKAYVAHVNAEGGIAGREIIASYHVYDPADLTGESVRTACIEATEEEQAFAVIGMPAWLASGTLCVAAEHDTPIIATTSLTPSLQNASEGRAFSIAMGLVRMFGGWATGLHERGELEGKTIGVITGDTDDTVTEAIDDGLIPTLEALGYTVAESIVLPCASVVCEQHDTAVERLRSSNVDLLFDALGPVSSPTFIGAAQAAGYQPEYTMSSTLLADTVAKFHESVADELAGSRGVGDFGTPVEGLPEPTDTYGEACVAVYNDEVDEPITDDAAGMMRQGCLMLDIIKRGAENVDQLGQDSLVVGIERLGSLDWLAVDDPNCEPSFRPGSFGPGKHDAGNWLTLNEFDPELSVFRRAEPCVWFEVDA